MLQVWEGSLTLNLHLTLNPTLQVWEGSVSGSAVGIGLSLASVLCGAAMLSFSGRALSEKLDVFRCNSPRCMHTRLSIIS